ncbi:hypothetical protein CYMTET_6433 [Cymbomonas tetramitiformis]|uniref:Uncharacterized protein n=1 Tax=Cymbomonas tetramitiformis TaxID=36881 RepID=A0AAE0GXD7_9CHLO|nr:hypothetical protein CYMTET_6433 [Cymbomonas tetramitiformis]
MSSVSSMDSSIQTFIVSAHLSQTDWKTKEELCMSDDEASIDHEKVLDKAGPSNAAQSTASWSDRSDMDEDDEQPRDVKGKGRAVAEDGRAKKRARTLLTLPRHPETGYLQVMCNTCQSNPEIPTKLWCAYCRAKKSSCWRVRYDGVTQCELKMQYFLEHTDNVDITRIEYNMGKEFMDLEAYWVEENRLRNFQNTDAEK